ncbi:hypothetical protein [Reichenbachiella sp. MALMAid0571]|uniref:hypothetical protein n=1 Tax=Reichenbachiella sp. MALMAid0571 TaxID=3143939 RepID=UPI0032DF1A41
MRYQDKDIKKLRGIFPAESKKPDKDEPGENSPAVFSTGQFYAIGSEDEVIRRFEIICSEKKYSFSYALLPIYILENNARLYIKAYELLITIVGRNLSPVHKHFNRENILWIKASASGKDDGSAATFIKDIIIEGEAVNESN